MAVSILVLGFIALVCSLAFEKTSQISFSNYKNELGILVLVGILNLVAFWLSIQGFKYMPLWQQSLFSLFTPVLTGIFAFWILKEPLVAKMFLGLVIMGVGLYITVR